MIFSSAGITEPLLEGVGSVIDDCCGEVVFVHGLGGSSRTTWQVDDARSSWPEWLADDLSEEKISVSVLEYPADPFTYFGSAGADFGIPDRGQSLLNYLFSMGVGSKPVIFITHSAGGLVIKQALRSACDGKGEEWELLSRNTRSVVFLATPHNGAGLGNVARLFNFSTLAAQLDNNNEYLRNLSQWYRANACWRTHAFFEGKPTMGIRVVDQSSADPGVRDCRPTGLDGDHFTVCKPRTKRSPVYVATLSIIRKDLLSSGANRSRASMSGAMVPDSFWNVMTIALGEMIVSSENKTRYRLDLQRLERKIAEQMVQFAGAVEVQEQTIHELLSKLSRLGAAKEFLTIEDGDVVIDTEGAQAEQPGGVEKADTIMNRFIRERLEELKRDLESDLNSDNEMVLPTAPSIADPVFLRPRKRSVNGILKAFKNRLRD